MTYEIKETLLRVENVSKNYDVPILKDISFEIKNITRPDIHQGQIVSLMKREVTERQIVIVWAKH